MLRWCIKKDYAHLFVKHTLNASVLKNIENKDEEHEDKNNDTITTSSSNETPPHWHKTKTKQTARKIESNHAPYSHSSNIEVSEEYIDIANKSNLQSFLST